MPIPNAAGAFIPPNKLSDYLLNEQHSVGESKARWFLGLGYDVDIPDQLGNDLLKLVQGSEAYEEKDSPFGTKYVVSGRISAPNGHEANVVSVWIAEPPDHRPRLVTAYPGEKS